MAEYGRGDVRLQPPGAGLPFLELNLSRLGFRLARQILSRDGASARFCHEAECIMALARSLEPSLAARPVLVPRLTGLEDSSRRWSVLMAVDHLVIVDSGIVVIIEHLAAERPFGAEVTTAGVKPGPVQDAGVIKRFTDCVQNYLTRLGALRSLRSAVRHRHPWFGPLDGHGWHCLAAMHHTIHRRQIERIIRLLGHPART